MEDGGWDRFLIIENGGLGLSMGRTSGRWMTGASVTTGVWQHVVTVYDNGAMRFYHNGTEYTTGETEGEHSSAGTFTIGANQNGGVNSYTGIIDEVAVWDEALTAAEITTLYNSGNGLDAASNSGSYTSSGNLVGYYKMDDGAGNTTIDASGNANNATLNNMDASTDWVTDVPFSSAISALNIYGQSTTTSIDFVDSNGKVGGSLGIDKYGRQENVSDNIITSGLVMYLDASNLDSYSGTGTTWSDLSGNGNHGTLQNGVTYNNANNGSLVFDGVNDFFVTNSNLDLSDTDKLTIQLIVKTAGAGTEIIMEHSINWNANNSFGVYYDGDSKTQFTDHNQNYNVSKSGASINDNNWHLLSATTDRSLGATDQNLIYIDGEAENSVNVSGLINDNSGNFTSHKLYISSRAGTNYFFNGTIAQVLIYNRVLTAEEIQRNFNSLKLKYGLYSSSPSGDGLTSATASSSAYQIKQDFPASADGLYWIANSNINSGTAFQIYADMTTDGGGWTLIMCNQSYLGWTYTNTISRNVGSPSISSNYSIVAWADYIKKSTTGFQYMLDADTRGANGGIWTVNNNISFTSNSNASTIASGAITRNIKYGTWPEEDNGDNLAPRMPYYTSTNPAFLTTDLDGGHWWGALVTSSPSFVTAPWMNTGGVQTPAYIWYWVR